MFLVTDSFSSSNFSKFSDFSFDLTVGLFDSDEDFYSLPFEERHNTETIQSLCRAISLPSLCIFLVTSLRLGDGSFQVRETILQYQLDQTKPFFFRTNDKSENKCEMEQ